MAKKKVKEQPLNRTVDILKGLEAAKSDTFSILGTSGGSVPRISTGVLALDIALGGGFPCGRIVELYGAEMSGKTTLTYHAIAAAQALGGVAAFVDVEHAVDVGYATKLGVDFDKLLFAQPDSGEQAWDALIGLVPQLKKGDIMVVDSVANLVPEAELSGETGDHHVGLQARMMARGLRKITGMLSDSGAILVFINQIRSRIGVMYGSNETTTGGNALKFYASQRIEVKAATKETRKINDVDTPVGQLTRINVTKSKVSPPFKKVEVDLEYGVGFPKARNLIKLGAAIGIIEKGGAWFSFRESRLGQGIQKASVFLQEHPEWMDTIEKEILNHYKTNR